MKLDKQVEQRLRKAYSAAIGKDMAGVTAALEGISNEDSRKLLGLGLYVTGYIVNDHNRDGLQNENVRRLATEVVDGEHDWIDTGDADHVAKFLTAAATDDVDEINRLGPENVTALTIVTGAHLLAHYRQPGERWYQYLDAILDQFEVVDGP
jgi:hypothetical protein